MAKFHSLYKEILPKKNILDKAKIQLKLEFVGIDRVIEELIDALSSWYLFSDLQDKPVIINLWGLTGVGKSSLVKRVAELLFFTEKFYHFNLGESNDKFWDIKDQIGKIYENANGYPVIIALDEFQHAKSLDENAKEMSNSSLTVFWEILGDGCFQVSRRSHDLEEIYHITLKLKHLIQKGVVVENGIVVSDKEFFIKEMELTTSYKHFRREKGTLRSKALSFVPEDFIKTIYILAKEIFPSVFDVMSELNKLNAYQTIEFLTKVYEFAKSPKTIDCSKALLFVLGNLDEAYKMSSDYNPDMNADEFHEQSLKINISKIKRALSFRFRNEQIARLGNIHIIYPAFSSETFQKIIKLELSKIQAKVQNLQNVMINFDETICKLIYKEGVYPAQGSRPVFTTIHQMISTKLGRLFSESILNKIKPSHIVFRAENNVIIVDYFKEEKLIHSFSEKAVLNLEKLRENRKDDMQAITAVHESGHAVAAVILLKTIPEIIYSVTASVESHGFTHTKLKCKYVSKNHIIKTVAFFLAGYVAEKLVFGEENITTGAEDDIQKATFFVTTMLKSCGMGSLQASFQVKNFSTNNFIHDENNIINEEAKTLIQKAFSLAEKTLKEQQLLLLRMSDYLADNRYMTKEVIEKMIENYADSFSISEVIKNGDLFFYRNCLKEKIYSEKPKENGGDKTIVNTFEISLNKMRDGY